jgi:hypothetical protein
VHERNYRQDPGAVHPRRERVVMDEELRRGLLDIGIPGLLAICLIAGAGAAASYLGAF